MRIALIGDGESPHLLKWARALARAPGIELWAASSRGLLPGFDDVVAMDRRLLLRDPAGYGGSSLSWLAALPRLGRWLRGIDADWLHAHYLTLHGVLAWLVRRVWRPGARINGSDSGSLRFPDDKAGLAPRAYAAARSWVRDPGVGMNFSTAPPMSAHALAARLASDGGLPWVADFRDLWSDNPGYAAPAWRRRIDQRTEAAWLRQVSGVVTVTPSWRALPEGRLRGRCPVAFIPNGFDEADFAGLGVAPARADADFRLLHAGSFYGPRDPTSLLEGLARFIYHDRRLAQPLRLRLVGQIGSRFAGALARFEQEHPGVVESLPYLPHRQALAEMMAADALLLMVGAGGQQAERAVVAGWLPGKIFEYLRAARPMLLLGDPQGDAAQLLKRHGQGWIADETKPEQIAHALQQMMSAPRGAVAAQASVAQFERRALAGELAAFLHRCR